MCLGSYICSDFTPGTIPLIGVGSGRCFSPWPLLHMPTNRSEFSCWFQVWKRTIGPQVEYILPGLLLVRWSVRSRHSNQKLLCLWLLRICLFTCWMISSCITSIRMDVMYYVTGLYTHLPGSLLTLSKVVGEPLVWWTDHLSPNRARSWASLQDEAVEEVVLPATSWLVQ